MTEKELFKIMEEDAALIGEALLALYPNAKGKLLGLIEAEKYSLLAPGKRIRPILAIEFSKMLGGTVEAALPYAVALEMVHAASLIHDDLPAIDNDDLRRGRPTNHKVFGEANAILAGDGLIIDAFSTIASNPAVSPEMGISAVKFFSDSIGAMGLVGGEYLDVLGEKEALTKDELYLTHSMKTGALIAAATQLGAISAGKPLGSPEANDAKRYADGIGTAFQIIDDLLDRTGSTEELGKTVGKDERSNKTTFLTFFSEKEALREAERLTADAVSAIEKYEGHEFLSALAKYLLKRRK